MRPTPIATLPTLLLATVLVLLLNTAPLEAAPPDSATSEIILDYQRMEAFRDRLRDAIVHVAVVRRVQSGFDPSLRPVHTGAVTFVRLPDHRVITVASAILLHDAERITLIAGPGRESSARMTRTLDDLGLVLLEVDNIDALGPIQPLDMAPSTDPVAVGRTVFSLDNLATGFETVVWGQVLEIGVHPLEHLRVVDIKLTRGHPIVDAKARLVGVCFRAVTADNPICFASRATDLLRELTVSPTGPSTGPQAR